MDQLPARGAVRTAETACSRQEVPCGVTPAAFYHAVPHRPPMVYLSRREMTHICLGTYR